MVELLDLVALLDMIELRGLEVDLMHLIAMFLLVGRSIVHLLRTLELQRQLRPNYLL